MPSDSGQITSDDKRRVEDWLKDNWIVATKACPISGHNDWIIGDHIVQPNTYAGGGLSVGGTGYPMVMLICNGCGYTMYFNAVKLGLVAGNKSEGSND